MSACTHRFMVLGALAILCYAPAATVAQSAGSSTPTYLELLEGYASGHEEEALRRLIGLEWHLVEMGQDLERERESQLSLIEALRPSDARIIPPVVALHESAYLAYRAEGAVTHAVHARTIMIQLCELMADRVLTAAERRLAGDLFASLGGYSQESSTGPVAMDLFRQAVALDPANEAALLSLAADLERRGRFGKALPLLKRLNRHHPENAEGRLRLAINLDRAGEDVRAMELLRGLLETESPPWILSLAHQTLARLLLDEGRLDGALGVLADGFGRRPEDPTLAVALAYVTERLAAESGEIVLPDVSVPIDPSPGRPPRFVYARHPAEVFERLRTRLRRDSRAHRGVLAEALAERSSPASN